MSLFGAGVTAQPVNVMLEITKPVIRNFLIMILYSHHSHSFFAISDPLKL